MLTSPFKQRPNRIRARCNVGGYPLVNFTRDILWQTKRGSRRQRERGSGIDRPLAALGGSMTSELRRYTGPIVNRTNTRQGP
jgi:hypothetical protein